MDICIGAALVVATVLVLAFISRDENGESRRDKFR